MAMAEARAATGHRGRGPAPSWVLMQEDMLQLIASRVLAGDLLDYVRFRAVCLPWRAATACPRGQGLVNPLFHPRRWMMLPEGDGMHPGHPALGGYGRFFNLDTAAFVRVRLPCFQDQDHIVLDCPDGLLLLQRKGDGAICLHHPFTGDIAQFPPLASLITQLDGAVGVAGVDARLLLRFDRFMDVSAAVSVRAGGTVTIMLAFIRLQRMAYVSTGDLQWTATSWMIPGMWTAVPFRGSLYLVKGWNKRKPSLIMRVDPPECSSSVLWSSAPAQTVATCPAEKMTKPYLVECNSELLVVGYAKADRHSLVVFRLADLLLGAPTPAAPLASIGDHVLFIGKRNMTVKSKNIPVLRGNSVAIITASAADRLLQYNLGRGAWSQLCDGDLINGPAPRPHSLVHHIVTCCHHAFWSSGHIWYVKSTEPWRRMTAGAYIKQYLL
ncbi:uncharacterized protein LOC100834947 [Brachypodium distachyon]|uniref:KIB1-4 beta-propeller domain-containing protein n=1 Tax=Brachypodium distachyon TaxID=15368 RepID=A0A0Q3EM71_BRADI|nr:uncharacterized protein LOC100834947 [Brachypodium distachyon]XP_014757677.1 uncharacterized protein LOC100834947 [Brachypodium distachyon]XP_024318564.1 uncharacterized protein LOC100834947 [Brachypodium distachyon]KQJ88631.1 hypothetical protein BRADI_4g20030v3 [Brachypodium distachyon]|eukprot:XP_003576077.2 uncharacterized protein LOC100834947 [Brachypodium distachyon]